MVSTAVAAARDAGVRRVLLLSAVGSSARSANPHLRARGRAEEAVRASGLEHVIVRITHSLFPGGAWRAVVEALAVRWPGVVVGPGTQVVAPVALPDVASVLAAADDRDRVASGTWSLEGPEALTADELAAALSGRRPRVHLPPRVAARAASLLGVSLNRASAELLAVDHRADGPDAAAEFGVVRTPLDLAPRPRPPDLSGPPRGPGPGE
jgi:NADH dehydrogenase